MSIQFPEIRRQIIFLTEALVNADKIDAAKPHDVSLTAQFFIDQWDLDKEDDAAVSGYLKPVEVPKVNALAKLLLALVQKYGWELTTDAYVKKPEWANIKASARCVLEEFTRGV